MWYAAKNPTPAIARSGDFSRRKTGVPAEIALSLGAVVFGNQKFASSTTPDRPPRGATTELRKSNHF
jgi:hypothetical protein